jgi:ABC-type nitrate/sulfonate/bicarbonate transport system substrate-binding protein
MTTSFTLGRRQFVAGAAATGLAGLSGSAFAQQKQLTPIAIANSQGLASTTLSAMMKNEKIYEEFGIDPKVLGVSDGTKILSGLIGGDVDFAALTGFSQVFPAVEKGGKIKIVGSGGTLLSVLAMFSGKANIKTVKDLEGKTVGTGGTGSLLHQLSMALFKKTGVDASKVQFVNIGSSVDVFRAVSAGVIDAGFGDGNYIRIADRYKVHLVEGGHLNVDLPEYTLQGAFTTEKAIETKRDVIVRTLAAYGKLFRLLHNPAGKDAFMKARAEVAKSTTAEDNESTWDYIQTYKPYGVNLVISEERINYMQQLNVDFGVQKSILPYDRVTDMSIARDALKLIGGPI